MLFMKNMRNLYISLLFIVLLFPAPTPAQSEKEVIILLDTAETLFRELKNKNYSMVWETITAKSKDRIIKDTHKELKKSGETTTLEDVEKDFDKCASICKLYWDGFLTTFDPDLAMNQSKWDVGKVERKKAEILITHKKSENPAKLKMFKENGKWKVGLVETFWIRKDR